MIVCESRRDLNLPIAKLAYAVLQQAFEDLTLYPTRTNSPYLAGVKNETRIEARDWLLDTTSSGPHSLRQVCAIISVSSGIEVAPEMIADACRRGLVLTNEQYIRRGPGTNSQMRIRINRKAA